MELIIYFYVNYDICVLSTNIYVVKSFLSNWLASCRHVFNSRNIFILTRSSLSKEHYIKNKSERILKHYILH